MKKIFLISLVLGGIAVAFVLYFAWPRSESEIQVRETKKSADGKWTAVVELEVFSSGFVSDAVYAVRLKGAAQRDAQGDLVMNVPVNYPEPEPSIEWNNGALVVTLLDHQKPQHFVAPVSGVAVSLQQK